MAMPRVTKIVCPSCKGTGKFTIPLVSCMWCRGDIRVPVSTAHSYADQLYMIAGGGYICGDHDYEHKAEMERRAEMIYSLTGHTAPWKPKRGRQHDE